MEKLKKHTMNFRQSDWDYLTSVYRNRGVSTSFVIRRIVSDYVNRLREKEADRTVPDIETDV